MGLGSPLQLQRLLLHPLPGSHTWVSPSAPGEASQLLTLCALCLSPCLRPCRSFSPLCTDPATLKAGVAEGRANVVALARALFGGELPALRSIDGEAGRGCGQACAVLHACRLLA